MSSTTSLARRYWQAERGRDVPGTWERVCVASLPTAWLCRYDPSLVPKSLLSPSYFGCLAGVGLPQVDNLSCPSSWPFCVRAPMPATDGSLLHAWLVLFAARSLAAVGRLVGGFVDSFVLRSVPPCSSFCLSGRIPHHASFSPYHLSLSTQLLPFFFRPAPSCAPRFLDRS